MNEEKKAVRFQLNTVDKIILVVLAVLMVAMTALSIMSRCGLMLINGSLYILGAFAGIALILFWVGYALVRRIKKRTTRMAVTILLAVVLFILITIAVAFISMFTSLTIPVEFDTVVKGERQVVILRGYDVNEERMELRYQERISNNPDGNTELSLEDYGFCYYAYPKVMGIFYRADADVEGEIYISQNSDATLMIEWPDENTARLFVSDPGLCDGGEWYLRYSE